MKVRKLFSMCRNIFLFTLGKIGFFNYKMC